MLSYSVSTSLLASVLACEELRLFADRPHETDGLSGDGRHRLLLVLATAQQFQVLSMEPLLRLPGDPRGRESLDSTAEEDIEAESEQINPETYPAWARITYRFPARGKMPPVRFVWYEGRNNGRRVLPPEKLTKQLGLRGLPGSGSLVVGDNGVLYSPNASGSSYRFIGANAKDIEAAARKVPPNPPAQRQGRHRHEG